MNQLTYKSEDIIYQLTVEDVQTVAQEELGRELLDSEIEKIEDLIAENISWYDAISAAISEKIKYQESNEEFDD